MTLAPPARAAWRDLPALLALAAVLAGVALLLVGTAADLRAHARAHQALAARLPPVLQAAFDQLQRREDANPWHTVVAGGEALLVGGLAALYLGERRKRRPAPPAPSVPAASAPAPEGAPANPDPLRRVAPKARASEGAPQRDVSRWGPREARDSAERAPPDPLAAAEHAP